MGLATGGRGIVPSNVFSATRCVSASRRVGRELVGRLSGALRAGSGSLTPVAPPLATIRSDTSPDLLAITLLRELFVMRRIQPELHAVETLGFSCQSQSSIETDTGPLLKRGTVDLPLSSVGSFKSADAQVAQGHETAAARGQLGRVPSHGDRHGGADTHAPPECPAIAARHVPADAYALSS